VKHLTDSKAVVCLNSWQVVQVVNYEIGRILQIRFAGKYKLLMSVSAAEPTAKSLVKGGTRQNMRI
jgi:hypothetical protein